MFSVPSISFRNPTETAASHPATAGASFAVALLTIGRAYRGPMARSWETSLMPLLALFLLLVFLAVTFPIRSLIRRQMFGAAARDNYLEARPASWWVADLLFAAAFALLLAGPVGDLLGFWSMFFDPPLWLWLPASAVAALAILLVIWSQRTMGAAWRPPPTFVRFRLELLPAPAAFLDRRPSRRKGDGCPVPLSAVAGASIE